MATVNIDDMTQTQLEEYFRNTLVGYDLPTMRKVLSSLQKIFLGDMDKVREFLATANISIADSEEFARQAISTAEYVQTQLDVVTGEGTIDPAVEQLKVGLDGTIYNSPSEMFRTELTGTNTQLDTNTTSITRNSYRHTILERSNRNGSFRKVELPEEFSYDPPITILTDGKTFITDYNKENFKNGSQREIFVSPGGSDSNSGLTRSSPKLQFNSALSIANPGDTIVLLSGDYFRNSINNININKSINVIPEENVRLFIANNDTVYTKTASANYVYEASRANVFKVIDAEIKDNGIELTEVNSVEECDAMEGSYFKGSNNMLYVHTFGHREPTTLNSIELLVANGPVITNKDNSLNVFMENVKVFGGQTGTLSVNPESTNNMRVILDNVGLYHGAGLGDNGNLLNGYGGEIICYKCEGLYGEKDGFNYKKTSLSGNSTFPAPRFVEIDCIGANNGLKNRAINQDASNNGSTAHNGCVGLRINGSYYNNMGANVADVGSNCLSFVVGSEAYDSACKYNNEKSADFTTQQPGAKMWLIGAKAYDSTSSFNLYVIGGTEMHIQDTMFDVVTGSGTKEIVNPL